MPLSLWKTSCSSAALQLQSWHLVFCPVPRRTDGQPEHTVTFMLYRNSSSLCRWTAGYRLRLLYNHLHTLGLSLEVWGLKGLFSGLVLMASGDSGAAERDEVQLRHENSRLCLCSLWWILWCGLHEDNRTDSSPACEQKHKPKLSRASRTWSSIKWTKTVN